MTNFFGSFDHETILFGKQSSVFQGALGSDPNGIHAFRNFEIEFFNAKRPAAQEVGDSRTGGGSFLATPSG